MNHDIEIILVVEIDEQTNDLKILFVQRIGVSAAEVETKIEVEDENDENHDVSLLHSSVNIQPRQRKKRYDTDPGIRLRSFFTIGYAST